MCGTPPLQATSASEEDWYDKLSTYIKSLGSAGTFAMQNTLGSYWSPAPVPNLNIDGVGPINFPLSPQQASAIVFAGQAARYGQGAETVLDTKVRNARQVRGYFALHIHTRSQDTLHVRRLFNLFAMYHRVCCACVRACVRACVCVCVCAHRSPSSCSPEWLQMG